MGTAWAILLGFATLAGGAWAVVHFLGWVRERRERPILPTYSRDELRKRLTILVVDDAGFTYLQDFKDDGYLIDHRTRIDALRDIENYEHDVLVLDIRGIASHLSADDGLGVARHARRTMESLPIIIYSSATYSLAVDTSSADHVFEVSGGDYQAFRDLIDDAFERLTSPDYYVRHFRTTDHSVATEQDRQLLVEDIRAVLADARADLPVRTYSSHQTASRAANILRHATAVSSRLRRTDV